MGLRRSLPRTEIHCVMPLICTGRSSSTPLGETILRESAMMAIASARVSDGDVAAWEEDGCDEDCARAEAEARNSAKDARRRIAVRRKETPLGHGRCRGSR